MKINETYEEALFTNLAWFSAILTSEDTRSAKQGFAMRGPAVTSFRICLVPEGLANVLYLNTE